MRHDIVEKVDLYRRGLIDRRELLKSIIAVTGGYAAAHLFLESSGLAATLISSQEAQAANVDAETIHIHRVPMTSRPTSPSPREAEGIPASS